MRNNSATIVAKWDGCDTYLESYSVVACRSGGFEFLHRIISCDAACNNRSRVYLNLRCACRATGKAAAVGAIDKDAVIEPLV